jgi:hypothetical protein
MRHYSVSNKVRGLTEAEIPERIPLSTKNIGIVLPSGKKVKLTKFPLRKETVWLEVSEYDTPLDVWYRLNELYSRHVSRLAEYKLEDVREFLLKGGKGKLMAYRKSEVSDGRNYIFGKG